MNTRIANWQTLIRSIFQTNRIRSRELSLSNDSTSNSHQVFPVFRTLVERIKSVSNRTRQTRRSMCRSTSLLSESLEQRTLLTIASAVSGQLLTVTLTEDSDVVISEANGLIQLNGQDIDPATNAADILEIHVIGGDGDNAIDLSGVSNGTLPLLSRVVIDAGAGNDNVLGSQIADEIYGGDGDDFVVGNAGPDVIMGGDGNDILLGAAGSDAVFGEAGNDTVLGQGASLDSVSGGPGIDFIDGGSGGDTLVESISGVFTVDNFTAVNFTSGETDTLHRVENVSIEGSDGPDNISAAGLIGVATINGGLGNDVITGTEFPDVLSGYVGADLMAGRGGNDTMIAGGGNDTMAGGPGDDFFRGNGGDDLILGGDGNDAINGLSGFDTLEGDAGDDVIFGGSDADVIRAGDGNDFVDGGDHDDLIAGGRGHDVLVGSLGNDIVDGGAGNDLLFGGAGMDMMFGRGGNDLVKGQGHSRDSLSGGEGDDSVVGLISESHEDMVFDSPWLQDRILPVIEVMLSNDTGGLGFETDGVTFDGTLTGSVTSFVGPASGELRLAGQMTTFAVDPIDGTFQIDGAAINALANVVDGIQDAQVAIVDGNGEVTAIPFSFVLDRTGPIAQSTLPSNLATVTDLMSAVFSLDEVVDPDSVETIDFVMTDFGADGILGTNDDLPVEIERVETAGSDITVYPNGPLFSRLYNITLTDGSVVDQAGNVLGVGASLQFTNIDTTVRWRGGDGDWTNAANWNTGNVPNTGDRVVIDSGSNVTVRYNTSVELSSLTIRGNLDMSGGWLSVTEPSHISGGLMMDRAEVFLSGPEASLTVDGASTVDESTITIENGASFSAPNLGTLTNSFFRADGSSELLASSVSDATDTRFHLSGGAQLSLPLLSYDASLNGPLDSELIIVEGAGSVLDLSNVVTLRDSFKGWFQSVTRLIQARDGGVIDLSGVLSIEGPKKLRDRLELSELTGGRIEIGNVETTTAGPVRFGLSGAGRELLHLTTAAAIEFHPQDNTTLNVPLLTTLTSGSISVGVGTTLNLPLLTTLSNTKIRVSDSTSVLETPLVATADDAQFHLSGGATYSLPVTSLDFTNIEVQESSELVIVEGAGTIFDLSTVTSLGDAFNGWIQPVRRIISASDGGRIDLSSLSSLQGPNTDRDTLELASSGGGVIELDSLQQTTGGLVGLALSSVTQTFSQLATAAALSITASDGTRIVLPSLTSIGRGELTVSENSSVSMSNLQTMNFTKVTLSGATAILSTPHLVNADNSRFFISGGAGYTLPVVSYDVSEVDRIDFQIIRVEGVGSQLNMVSVLSFRDAFGGWAFPLARTVEAIDGGQIDLSMLTSVEGPTKSTDRLELSMSGGGMIQLSQLEDQTGGPVRLALDGITTTLGNLETATSLQIQAINNSNVVIPGLSTIDDGSIFVGSNSQVSLPLLSSINMSTITLQDSSSRLSVPLLNNVDNTRFFLSGGARLNLPNVTSYDVSGIDPSVSALIHITGFNSRLDLTQVQSLNAAFAPWITNFRHTILASDGGRITLTNLTSIVGPSQPNDVLSVGISSNGTIKLATVVNVTGTVDFAVNGADVSLAAFQAAN
jgi:Ca2+-binding RTX toxin-like protein